MHTHTHKPEIQSGKNSEFVAFWSEKIDNLPYPLAMMEENKIITTLLTEGARDQSSAENLKQKS